MKRLIISCEKCRFHRQLPVDSRLPEEWRESFPEWPQDKDYWGLRFFPTWPFVPAGLMCVNCGSQCLVRIVEKDMECSLTK